MANLNVFAPKTPAAPIGFTASPETVSTMSESTKRWVSRFAPYSGCKSHLAGTLEHYSALETAAERIASSVVALAPADATCRSLADVEMLLGEGHFEHLVDISTEHNRYDDGELDEGGALNARADAGFSVGLALGLRYGRMMPGEGGSEVEALPTDLTGLRELRARIDVAIAAIGAVVPMRGE